jgi:hypothetical protein
VVVPPTSRLPYATRGRTRSSSSSFVVPPEKMESPFVELVEASGVDRQ